MIDVLSSPRVLLAVLFLGVAGVLAGLLDLTRKHPGVASPAPASRRDHLFRPLLRAAIITCFVLLAYPALFGLRDAPPLGVLLAGDALRVNRLVGLSFLALLLLPMVSRFAAKSALLLPLQGLLATALVFGWFVHDLGVTAASVWPGTSTALVLAVYVFAGHRLALALGGMLGGTVDGQWPTRGGDQLVRSACETLVQAPVILLYGFALGQQVAI